FHQLTTRDFVTARLIRSFLAFRLQYLSSAPVEMEHVNRIASDGEDDTLDVFSLAIKEIPDLLFKVIVLWRKRAALRVVGQGFDGFQEPVVPPGGSQGCPPGSPFVRLFDLGLGGRLNDDQ